MATTPAFIDTCTLAESVLSYLIGSGTLDETNTRILRSYAEKAETVLGIKALDFYTDVYVYSDDEDFDFDGYAGDFDVLDQRVEKLVGRR